MKLNGNEITIYRGEAFTISKVLSNRDNTPYIISNELVNPHFLLSVSNTLYQQDKRYIKNYWLPINADFPTFDLTVPVNIKTLKNSDGSILYNDLASITSFPIEAYIDGKLVQISDRYAVFYDDDGVYKYWNNGWKNYICRLIKSISSDDTKDWKAQTYLYSIQLVTGEKGEEGLSRIDNTVPILPPTKIKVNNYAQGGIL